METIDTSSPIGDAERLKVLRQLRIDDARLDDSLSDVVRSVGELFQTRVCFINLVYLERQVFRSWFGAVPDELMRAGNTHERSLCTYVVEQSAPLVIQDLLDSATWHEPFDWPARVLDFYSALGVRFYVGLPLVTSRGHTLGTLCLIDMQPRQLAAAALESLQFFASKAAVELELASESETSRRLREELERTSRYASGLSEMLFGLQNVAEATRACEVGIELIRDTAALRFAALLTVGPDARVAASTGDLPEALKGGRIEPASQLWSLIDGAEARYLDDFAVIPLPVSVIDAPAALIVGREPSTPAHWSDADRFFLQGAARLIGTSIQRSSRVNYLEQAALTDELTGLANRRAFDLLAARPIDPAEKALVFIGDLAGFKLLNDTLGHPVGDLCLQRVAKSLLRSVRPEDRAHVFRYGGDEFAMVDHASGSDSAAIMSRFERAVSEALAEYEGLRLRLDIGAASVPDEAGSIAEAVALADSRMYQRKRTRTNDALSERERQVMRMIIDGKRVKEIAFELAVSDSTVATHRSRLMKKMKFRDNRDIFRYALRHGMID